MPREPPGGCGRPPKDRLAVARAFFAKAILNLPTTTILLDRLRLDVRLRPICGWERRGQVTSEAMFSQAFAEFATSGWPDAAHAALIETGYRDGPVVHIARYTTEIKIPTVSHTLSFGAGNCFALHNVRSE